jgi:hypothetical protein
MELFCAKCGRAVVVPEPFVAMRVTESTVVVDDSVVHSCRRAVLDDAVRLRREAKALRAQAARLNGAVIAGTD